ncbi:MAG: hypothetical protein JWN30_2084, partial [Bacilli bacterium]|nr:hypothetical protein [Bacilli bacterium]
MFRFLKKTSIFLSAILITYGVLPQSYLFQIGSTAVKADSSSSSSYLPCVENAYTTLTQHFTDSFLQGEVSSSSANAPRHTSDYAALSVKLYNATGNQLYLDNAVKAFRDIMTVLEQGPMDASKNKPLSYAVGDWFNLEPLLITYQELKPLGKVSSTDDSYIQYYADQFALFGLNRNIVGDNNQTLSRTAGVAWALNLFPNHPDAALWQKYVDENWNYWWPQRDLSEDAEGYSAIGLYEIIQIAVQTGKVDQLKDPGVKKMFDRYRDQLSTFGAMPMYGDDYFGEAWELCTYNFEYASRLYNDPMYLD